MKVINIKIEISEQEIEILKRLKSIPKHTPMPPGKLGYAFLVSMRMLIEKGLAQMTESGYQLTYLGLAAKHLI
jgi:hypothetical protein